MNDDILVSCKSIAEYIFGNAKLGHRVNYLVNSGQMPAFRIGSQISARKSKLDSWLAETESRSAAR